CDAAAVSVGADDVADAIRAEIANRKLDATIVRNGTRGMLWLEPLVEIENDGKRIGFGPIAIEDVPSLISGLFENAAHPKALGDVGEIPYFKSQQRVTFARC